VSFDGVTSGVSKRVAAAAFLEVLQLKTWGRIAVRQPAPFADIQLAPQTLGAM
jgi:chromatin segregation and condensation protein Rec8/ScpA/Scc1 (kleisin family)